MKEAGGRTRILTDIPHLSSYHHHLGLRRSSGGPHRYQSILVTIIHNWNILLNYYSPPVSRNLCECDGRSPGLCHHVEPHERETEYITVFIECINIFLFDRTSNSQNDKTDSHDPLLKVILNKWRQMMKIKKLFKPS